MNSRILYALKFFKYWITATHKKGHGIHSPFTYHFIIHVLNKKLIDNDLQEVFKAHDFYKQSSEHIELQKIGAGSKRKYSSKQTIGQIIKKSSVNKKQGKLLYNLVKYFNCKEILEFGTSVGISAAYIAQGAGNANFISIEGVESKINIAKQISQCLKQNTQFVPGNFDDITENILTRFEKLDLVFFDGNHKKENTINYFFACLNKVHNNTVFVFDDIHWSIEMEQAWEIIKNNEKVTLSIDLFRFGLIFFKKELSKEQFVIKF